MSAHRKDNSINQLKTYFNSVIEWVSTIFIDVLPEMKGLEWGRLYEDYHGRSYDPKMMSEQVKKLAVDDYVKNGKGTFEYLLGGSVDKKLLDIRVFDSHVKRAVYAKQTQEAEIKAESNCPHCAIGHTANKTKIYKLAEMDADHVSSWSKGGGSLTEIVRCFALLTIGQKVIDNNLSPSFGASGGIRTALLSTTG